MRRGNYSTFDVGYSVHQETVREMAQCVQGREDKKNACEKKIDEMAAMAVRYKCSQKTVKINTCNIRYIPLHAHRQAGEKWSGEEASINRIDRRRGEKVFNRAHAAVLLRV